MTERLSFDYDPATDVLTVEGIRYTGQLFRDFARDMPLQTPCQIAHRGDGTVVLQRLDMDPAESAETSDG